MTKKLRANEDILAQLHARVAQALLENIDDPDNGVAYINAAIKFLKENNIKADLDFNDTVKELDNKVEDVKNLPFDVEDDDQ